MERSMYLTVGLAAAGPATELRAVIAFQDTAERAALKASGFRYLDREWWLRGDDDALVAAMRALAGRGYTLRVGAGFERRRSPVEGTVPPGEIEFRALPNPREMALLRRLANLPMVRPVSGVDPKTRVPWTRDDPVTPEELERDVAPAPRPARAATDETVAPFMRRRTGRE